MNFLKRRPWIWLLLLFLLPLIPWGIFIYLAAHQPMHRVDKPHPPGTTEKVKEAQP